MWNSIDNGQKCTYQISCKRDSHVLELHAFLCVLRCFLHSGLYFFLLLSLSSRSTVTAVTMADTEPHRAAMPPATLAPLSLVHVLPTVHSHLLSSIEYDSGYKWASTFV